MSATRSVNHQVQLVPVFRVPAVSRRDLGLTLLPAGPALPVDGPFDGRRPEPLPTEVVTTAELVGARVSVREVVNALNSVEVAGAVPGFRGRTCSSWSGPSPDGTWVVLRMRFFPP